MPINPNILLQGQVADIGKAVGQGLEAYQQTRRNVLLEEQQKREAETTNISNAINLQKMQVQGAALAAQRALPYLQSGDMAGLKTFIQGTNLLDDQDKAELSAKIDANDLQGILGDVSGAIGMAQQMGIFAAPKEAADTRTSIEKNLEAAGFQPGTPEYRQALMQQMNKPSGTQVTLQMPPGRKAEEEAVAKIRAKEYEQVQNEAQTAADLRDTLSQLSTLQTKTGFGEETKADIARVFNSLGVNGDRLLNTNVANAQAANALSGKLISQALAAQKGVASDSDFKFQARIAPTIADEQKAYDFNIKSMRAIANRKIEKDQFYTNWYENNKNLEGVKKAWQDYINETPIFSDNVINPATGLPANYYEFRDELLMANPGASDQDVRAAWRNVTRRK